MPVPAQGPVRPLGRRALPRGHGVPQGARLDRARTTPRSAARFRAAGLVTVGKTNTPELGILPTTEPHAYGPTRNPWDTTRSTGGSSGGSAAAVAAGLVPIGARQRRRRLDPHPGQRVRAGRAQAHPGARVVGPEFGDVMGGLTCELVVSRSVRDTAAVLDAVHGMEPGDPYGAPEPARPYLDEVGADPGRLRIGVMTDSPGGAVAVHPDCVAAAEAAGPAARVARPPRRGVAPEGAWTTPTTPATSSPSGRPGAAWNLDYWSRRTGDADHRRRRRAAHLGARRGRPVGQRGRLAVRPASGSRLNAREVAGWWTEGHDLLLTPTIAEPPPPLGTFDSPPDNPLHGLFRAAEVVPFTPPFNVTGQPAISLPLHWNADGLPIGVQLVAAFGREDLLLRVAAQLEAAQPWADRRPPVHA